MGSIIASINLSEVIGALGTVLVGVLTWLAAYMKRKAQADANATKAETALFKLGVIATTLAGRAWDKLGPMVQQSMADGKISVEERTALEKAVQELITDFTDADDLKAVAEALGLPMAGVIAKIASMIIDMVVRSHDSEDHSQAATFPVTAGDPTQGG